PRGNAPRASHAASAHSHGAGRGAVFCDERSGARVRPAARSAGACPADPQARPRDRTGTCRCPVWRTFPPVHAPSDPHSPARLAPSRPRTSRPVSAGRGLPSRNSLSPCTEPSRAIYRRAMGDPEIIKHRLRAAGVSLPDALADMVLVAAGALIGALDELAGL